MGCEIKARHCPIHNIPFANRLLSWQGESGEYG